MSNDTFQSLSQHRAKLSKLQEKLEDINDNIKENNHNFFLQKQFIYPMIRQAELLPLL